MWFAVIGVGLLCLVALGVGVGVCRFALSMFCLCVGCVVLCGGSVVVRLRAGGGLRVCWGV